VVASVSLLVLPVFAQDAVEQEKFENLHNLIKPSPGESPWSAIPWLTNIGEARQKAAAEGKLLLVWHAGGGHPLGFS
jgi:hypothetical protein